MEKFIVWISQQLRELGWTWLAENIEWMLNTGVGVFLALAIPWLYKQFNTWRKQRKEKTEEAARYARNQERLKALNSHFSLGQLEKAQAIFVETQGQDIAPSKSIDLADAISWGNRVPLIPWFLETAFPAKGDDHRFYLVLGDSGMGKTTFLMNLYLRYLEQPPELRPWDIRLLPMKQKSEEEIRKIVEAGKERETILLLDAFDEDGQANTKIGGYRKRLDEWVELVQGFREVIITSRTQFFPNEDAYRGELKVPTFDPENKGYHCFKLKFISPFDDKDVVKYLDIKFPGKSPSAKEARQKAQTIIDRSPKLMVRPMLLSKIDDLLADTEREYEFSFEIYDALIESWISREASLFPKESREKFKKSLNRFSYDLARKLYLQWEQSNPNQPIAAQLSASEMDDFAREYDSALSRIQMDSKSFLNNDGDGNRKFSHKSVWEYFLALHMQTDPAFKEAIWQDDRLDMAKRFYLEMTVLPKMIQVPGGSFRMGSKERSDEQPIRRVYLDAFEIGKYPVTQRQWQAVMGNNPSHFKGEDLPVETVSWKDCQKFIQQLNQLTQINFRLPSEAEWEYAAGGGAENRTKYAGTNEEAQLGEYAWYRKNSDSKTHPVGTKLPNALGLYDMSGNAWEWCQDAWHGDYKGAPTDGSAWESGVGSSRVYRGGSWSFVAGYCRVADRGRSRPDFRSSSLGFRLART